MDEYTKAKREVNLRKLTLSTTKTYRKTRPVINQTAKLKKNNVEQLEGLQICIECVYDSNYNIILARTPEIGQGLGRILSCGARKPEQT